MEVYEMDNKTMLSAEEIVEYYGGSLEADNEAEEPEIIEELNTPTAEELRSRKQLWEG
jgi:hypothetical protein